MLKPTRIEALEGKDFCLPPTVIASAPRPGAELIVDAQFTFIE